MRILICDDEREYVEQLSAHVKEYMAGRGISCALDCETEPTRIMQGDAAPPTACPKRAWLLRSALVTRFRMR